MPRTYKKDIVSKFNFRGTWLPRLLTCAAAAILVGVSAPAAKFAHDGISQERFGWRAGRDFIVQNATFQELARNDPDIPFEARLVWWGNAYYLPPGVRDGGITATLWAGGISAAFAGIGLFVAALIKDKAHSRFFRNTWRMWFAVPVLVSLVAFIYSFVDTFTSDTPDVDGFLAAGPRPRPGTFLEEGSEPTFGIQGDYNIETWTCAIRPLLDLSGIPSPGPARENIGGGGWTIRLGNYNPCHPAMVSRWLTLPMFLVALLLWVLVFVYPLWGSRNHAESTRDVEMVNNNVAVADERPSSEQTGKMSLESSKSAAHT